jgi:hypothetical protein
LGEERKMKLEDVKSRKREKMFENLVKLKKFNKIKI